MIASYRWQLTWRRRPVARGRHFTSPYLVQPVSYGVLSALILRLRRDHHNSVCLRHDRGGGIGDRRIHGLQLPARWPLHTHLFGQSVYARRVLQRGTSAEYTSELLAPKY